MLGRALREKVMTFKSVSYKHALVGEERVDEYQREIARTCALFNWDAGLNSTLQQDALKPKLLSLDIGIYSWKVLYVDGAFLQVLRCTFVCNGSPHVEWEPGKGSKAVYPRDKLFDVPRAHENLQALVDVMCEKFVGVRGRFIQLERIAKEKN